MLPSGQLRYGERHSLLRTRQQLAERGLSVAIVDAPSNRQSGAFLNGLFGLGRHAAWRLSCAQSRDAGANLFKLALLLSSPLSFGQNHIAADPVSARRT
jgi:hypothetical protein